MATLERNSLQRPCFARRGAGYLRRRVAPSPDPARNLLPATAGSSDWGWG